MTHFVKHGHTANGKRHPLYRTWVKMRNRCNSPRCDAYPRYGGRGIRVCERWNDFSNFLADMGPRPLGTTLDRINNEGNYEPNNCRWATPKQQMRNRYNNKLNPADAEHIRIAYSLGISQKYIASEFKIHPSMVSRIVNGDRWNDNI